MTCTCVRVEDAVRYALEERALPACPEHPDPELATDAPPSIPLNDDRSLAGAISRALGTPVNLNPKDTAWN